MVVSLKGGAVAASEIVQEPMVEEPLERLAERLGDPGVQESLLALVEHLDLIALVVTSLDEFLRRGEEIAGVLAEGVAELKVAGSSGGETVSSLGAIARAGAKLAPRAVPLLERLGASEVLTEDAVANLELVIDALDEARAAARRNSAPRGATALLRALRNPDVAKGAQFFLAFAAALGRRMR